MESTIKLVRQYHVENKQPQRVNFIARQQSYHGNSFGALSLGNHKSRRAPFLPLFSSRFHHVSPCFAYLYKLDNESDEAYVKRLGDELEAKFQELGPKTVAAFFAETSKSASHYFKDVDGLFILSCWCHKWLHSCSAPLFQGDARNM